MDFGICFFVESSYCNSNPSKGNLVNRSGHTGSFQNTSYFKERGYDVGSDTSLQKFYTSKIPVSVVDDIKKEIWNDKKSEVLSIAESYGVTLTDYQIDVLTDMSYQGWYVSDVISSYKSSGLSSATKAASSGFTNSGDRGEARWTLFSTGKYLDSSGNEIKVSSSSSSSGNSSLASTAKSIYEYMYEHNYTYFDYVSELSNTFEGSKSIRKTCCATYVSWVLQDANYISDSEHFNSVEAANNLFSSKGWKTVSLSNAKAGDIVVYNDGSHIEMYAGNNKVYSGGYDETPQGPTNLLRSESQITIYRASK